MVREGFWEESGTESTYNFPLGGGQQWPKSLFCSIGLGGIAEIVFLVGSWRVGLSCVSLLATDPSGRKLRVQCLCSVTVVLAWSDNDLIEPGWISPMLIWVSTILPQRPRSERQMENDPLGLKLLLEEETSIGNDELEKNKSKIRNKSRDIYWEHAIHKAL